MKTFAQKILAAEQINTRKEKFEMLGGFSAEEKRLLWYTFNPYQVFGIRKYDEPSSYAEVDSSTSFFFALLDLLHIRDLTGNAAKAAVTSTLGRYTETTAKVFARVLNKDLECGANRDSFEKIYTDLNIPKFDLMLASKIEEDAKTLTTEILKNKYGLEFPVLAESKYDGNRMLAMVKKQLGQYSVEFFSRSGKPSQLGSDLIKSELIKMAEFANTDIVVDGEVLASSFQETMNAKGSDNIEAKKNLKFFVFDWMTVLEWEANACPHNQTTRSNLLESCITSLGLVKVVKSRYKICNSIQELRDFYGEVLEEGKNHDGTLNGLGEGLIVKSLHGFYEWERSSAIIDRKTKKVTKSVYWIKWKPVITIDLQIVGFEYGNGRLEGTVGNLLLEGFDENNTFIKASCGSGLNDKTRAYLLDLFTNSPGKILGKTVEIEAQEISLAANSTVHSARFPIFIQVRDEK